MVDKINPYVTLTPETKTQAKTKGDGRFEQLLNQASESKPAASTESRLTMTGIDPLAGLNFSSFNDPTLEAERTLDTMERLSNALADQSVTPKDMEPLINKLDAEADKLMSSAEALPADHPGREIMRNTAVLAKVQVEKYNRGEFI